MLVRVKRCGKSAPAAGQPVRLGKPQELKDQIGRQRLASAGLRAARPMSVGRSMEPVRECRPG